MVKDSGMLGVVKEKSKYFILIVNRLHRLSSLIMADLDRSEKSENIKEYIITFIPKTLCRLIEELIFT